MREISAADMEIYRETARRNKALMQEKRDLRAKLAWEVAGKAARKSGVFPLEALRLFDEAKARSDDFSFGQGRRRAL